MSAVASPFQLLEINIISAQDLVPVTKSVRAYAVAWLHPERKLATQIDQFGHTSPTWNEKFVFRVDEEFLNSETSVIMIEIYTSAWLRDILVGTVGVLISNLLPPSTRSGNRKSKLRFVALQIRRPSGRPQGILNIGVTLLDSTMRSMPMYSELSTSAVGYWDIMESKNNNKNNKKNKKHDGAKLENHENIENENSSLDIKLLTLQRCQSEKNDSSVNDYSYHGKHGGNNNGYVFDGHCSEVGVGKKGGGVVIVNADGSLCSDVGPSPSVVAAAIAKGLYPPVPVPPRTAESSGIDKWSESSSAEGIKTKIEKWRNELTPAYNDDLDSDIKKLNKQATPKRNGGQRQRRNGLCSCFGTVFGCEISITCGGGNNKNRHGKSGKAHLTNGSELTYDESYI